MNKKIEYFNAFLFELLNWYKNDVNKDDNDLSKLKVLKLLFLWVSKNKVALDIFDNFVAWDLWPVEEDVYKAIKDNCLCNFCVSNSSLTLNNEKCDISEEAIVMAKYIIEFLKEKNSNLIKLSASSLVDITHKWNCWDIARSFGLLNIPANLILSEEWYFS